MNETLRTSIRILIKEILSEMSSDISQLMSSKNPYDEDKCEDSKSELDEFSGAGAIAGFSLPLGTSPDQPVIGSLLRKKNKKRKKSSYA